MPLELFSIVSLQRGPNVARSTYHNDRPALCGSKDTLVSWNRDQQVLALDASSCYGHLELGSDTLFSAAGSSGIYHFEHFLTRVEVGITLVTSSCGVLSNFM